ncbi:hypothetical protein ACIBKZ_28725 [Streptomyces sp. NPDC050421]
MSGLVSSGPQGRTEPLSQLPEFGTTLATGRDGPSTAHVLPLAG